MKEVSTLYNNLVLLFQTTMASIASSKNSMRFAHRLLVRNAINNNNNSNILQDTTKPFASIPKFLKNIASKERLLFFGEILLLFDLFAWVPCKVFEGKITISSSAILISTDGALNKLYSFIIPASFNKETFFRSRELQLMLIFSSRS